MFQLAPTKRTTIAFGNILENDSETISEGSKRLTNCDKEGDFEGNFFIKE